MVLIVVLHLAEAQLRVTASDVYLVSPLSQLFGGTAVNKADHTFPLGQKM